MLVRSPLPWREVDDFGRYRRTALDLLQEPTAVLTVQRSSTPYRWSLTSKRATMELAAQEAGLKAYFRHARDSEETVLPAGHTLSQPRTTAWLRPDASRLHAERQRWLAATALACELNASAPAQAAPVASFDGLDELDQCALRTLCFEAPIPLCIELEQTARRLVAGGYALVTFKGLLVRRAVWDVAPEQRKQGRLRVEFARDSGAA